MAVGFIRRIFSILPGDWAWLKRTAALRGVSASEVLRGLIQKAKGSISQTCRRRG